MLQSDLCVMCCGLESVWCQRTLLVVRDIVMSQCGVLAC